MPPAICILVFLCKLGESHHRVFIASSAKGSALQITILDIDVVVELWIALLRDHREQKHILGVNGRVLDFEPKLDGILTSPLLEGRCVEADEAVGGVEVGRHVAVVASDSVKDNARISQSAKYTSTLCRHGEKDIFETLFPLKSD